MRPRSQSRSNPGTIMNNLAQRNEYPRMDFHGFVRAAAAVPSLRVADCSHNANYILKLLKRAESEQVSVVVFPELSLTGYTCADLFHQTALQRSALAAL